jgi:hypothetical protein
MTDKVLAIIEFNLGKYDYLRDEYVQESPMMTEARGGIEGNSAQEYS